MRGTPVYHSITERFFMWGLPRMLAVSLWTGVLAFTLGLRQLWILPVGVLLHRGALFLVRKDPYMLEVLLALLRQDRRLDP